VILGAIAWAGLLDQGTEASRHLEFCKSAAGDAEAAGQLERAAGVWKACAGEAERLQFTEILSPLRAQADLSTVAAEAESVRASDVQAWAIQILDRAAEYPTIDLPTDIVPRTWRAWMESDRGRAYANDVRVVTAFWSGTESAAQRELLRSYFENIGLNWADPGNPEVDLVVNVSAAVSSTAGEASKQGVMQVSTVKIKVDSVRFRRSERSAAGFSVGATAEAADLPVAQEEATRQACDAAARAVLGRVLEELFDR